MIKKHIAVFMLSLAFASCGNFKENKDAPANHRIAQLPDSLMSDTVSSSQEEIYSGMINNVRIIFRQTNYTRFTLFRGNASTSGNLNTERGFENDENATLYILNDDKPEKEHIYFVRYSDGKFIMLDAMKMPVPDGELLRQLK